MNNRKLTTSENFSEVTDKFESPLSLTAPKIVAFALTVLLYGFRILVLCMQYREFSSNYDFYTTRFEKYKIAEISLRNAMKFLLEMISDNAFVIFGFLMAIFFVGFVEYTAKENDVTETVLLNDVLHGIFMVFCVYYFRNDPISFKLLCSISGISQVLLALSIIVSIFFLITYATFPSFRTKSNIPLYIFMVPAIVAFFDNVFFNVRLNRRIISAIKANAPPASSIPTNFVSKITSLAEKYNFNPKNILYTNANFPLSLTYDLFTPYLIVPTSHFSVSEIPVVIANALLEIAQSTTNITPILMVIEIFSILFLTFFVPWFYMKYYTKYSKLSFSVCFLIILRCFFVFVDSLKKSLFCSVIPKFDDVIIAENYSEEHARTILMLVFEAITAIGDEWALVCDFKPYTHSVIGIFSPLSRLERLKINLKR